MHALIHNGRTQNCVFSVQGLYEILYIHYIGYRVSVHAV